MTPLAPCVTVIVSWFTITETELEVAEAGKDALSVTVQETVYEPTDSLKT
jgi:hypothetical protein